jgi:ankyrin repeat protein
MTLWDAAMSGDAAALTAALDAEPATLNEPGPGGWPALHLAGHFGHLECVELLLARGADIHLRSANELQNLATHAAAAGRVPEKRASILERLLDAGILVDVTQHGGFTALHSACQNKDEASIQLLLARGADIDKPADDGRTPASLRKA